MPKTGRYWAFSKDTFEKARAEGRVYFGKDGNRLPIIKRYQEIVREGVAPRSWLPASDVGTNQSAKRDHLNKLLPGLNFETPKPEGLIKRVMDVSSNPGDLVLDSFLGSGTTAAVAHKMGRRWIGIEVGAHARTHCKPRLDKVIAGEQGGISEAQGWQGGGGYRYYRLGETVFDADGRISANVRFAALAAHIWFYETGEPRDPAAPPGPYLGQHNGRGYALLYNGVLGDRRPDGGNVLTAATLALIREASGDGPLTIYGEASRLGEARLREAGVTFKQTPYDVKAR